MKKLLIVLFMVVFGTMAFTQDVRVVYSHFRDSKSRIELTAKHDYHYIIVGNDTHSYRFKDVYKGERISVYRLMSDKKSKFRVKEYMINENPVNKPYSRRK